METLLQSNTKHAFFTSFLRTENGFRCPCGKCCMQQYLYGNCREKGDGFPCLDRTVLSRSEKRILVKRLTDQSEDIKIKFQRLVKSIKIWISENKPCFSPEQLKDFASKHPSVDIASDFETIYQELETCGVWTWFSFDYLKAVMQLCLPEGFDEYHEFIEECGDYCRRRLLECPHIMAGYEMEYQIPLFARLRDGGLKVASLRSVGEEFVRKS